MSARENPAHKHMTSPPISDETLLKIAKEISVKFIEVGRITPANFAVSFKNIYTSIDTTVNHK